MEKCIRAIAATSKGSIETWALGFLGLYGPSGTRYRELSAVDEDERPTVLLDALQAYLAEGQDWDQRFFAGFVRSAVRRHLGGESPDFGDETHRDQERRAEYRRRESQRKMEEWDDEDEEAEARMAELWSWWEDLPPEKRQEIEAEARERAGGVPRKLQRPILIGVMAEHRDHLEATGTEG